MARTLGIANSTTAETWSATSGASGFGTWQDRPHGYCGRGDKTHHRRTLRVATKHHLVFGQVPAMETTWAPASLIPSTPVAHWSLAG